MDRKPDNNPRVEIPPTSSINEDLPAGCADQVLAHELSRLAQAMRETLGFTNISGDAALQNSVQRGEKLLAVFHLVEHLNLEDWHNIVKRQGLTGWLALDLSRSTHHSMAALLKSIEGQLYAESADQVTGLANELVFMRKLSQELQRASRSGTELSLAMVEIDEAAVPVSTNMNPVYQCLAEHFSGTTRDYDTVARLGEQRFALLLPAASPVKAQIMVGRILSHFREELFRFNGVNPLSFTFSAGVATFGGRLRIPSTDEAVSMADVPLRSAQLQGGNKVVMSNHKPDTHSDRATLVHSIEKQFLFSGSE